MQDRRILTASDLLQNGKWVTPAEIKNGDRIYGYAVKAITDSPKQNSSIVFTSNDTTCISSVTFSETTGTRAVNMQISSSYSNTGSSGSSWYHRYFLDCGLSLFTLGTYTINTTRPMERSYGYSSSYTREENYKLPYYVPVYWGAELYFIHELQSSSGSSTYHYSVSTAETLNNNIQIFYNGGTNTFETNNDNILFLIEDITTPEININDYNSGIYVLTREGLIKHSSFADKYCQGVVLINRQNNIGFVISKFNMGSLYLMYWSQNQSSTLISTMQGSNGQFTSYYPNTTSDVSVALTDFKGYENTRALKSQATGNLDMVNQTTEVVRVGSHSFQGYVPSAGEWNLILQNKSEIDTLLGSINGKSLSSSSYLLSTQASSTQGYYWSGGSVTPKIEICNKTQRSDVRYIFPIIPKE